jgi:hypothetical protein
MNPLLALSTSIAVLGGMWTFLALGPLHGFVLVWAGFLAWGSFFHTGGDEKALMKTVSGTAYGALIAWVCFLVLTAAPIPALGAVYPAIVVGATVFCLVIVAGIEPLSAVPANVYGYAAFVAYSLHQAATATATGPLENLLTPSFANPLVLIAVSTTAGAAFGWLSSQLAKALGKAVPASA